MNQYHSMKKHISLYRKLIITLCVLSLFPYCGIVSGIICLIILKKLPGDIENVRGNLLGGARRLIVIVSCLGIAINIVAVIIFYVVMPPRIIRTEKNYGREIDRWAGDFSREYLRALAALECSGMNPPPSRFEAQFHKKRSSAYRIRNCGIWRHRKVHFKSWDIIPLNRK